MTDETKPLLDTQTRGHHPDSPSSLQASEACPFFENEQRESPAALKGTLQHKAAETRDMEVLDGDIEMENAVNLALRYEDAVRAKYSVDEKEIGEVAEIYLPVGDDIVNGTWKGVTGGFPDKVLIFPVKRLAVILDWKFGKVPVTPTKINLQGIAYYLGVLQHPEIGPLVDEVEVHFYHPYQGWSEEDHANMFVYRFTRAGASVHELRVRAVVARKHAVAGKEATIENGACPKADLCLWCAKKDGRCSAVNSLILAGSKHKEIEIPETLDIVRIETPEQFRRAFRFCNQIESVIKSIKKRCTDMVLTENFDPGEEFKLVRRREREITDPRKLIAVAKDNFGLTDDDIASIQRIPITKVTDLIKKTAPKGKGAARIREFDLILAEQGIAVLGNPVHFLQEVKTPAEKKQDVIDVTADKVETSQ